MSFHRENIIWQSADGTWSRGFFTCQPLGYSRHGDDDDDEPDPEWDVDYDFGSFEWVSAGHPSEAAADASWDGANPGGSSTQRWAPSSAAAALEYDVMAARLELRERRRTAELLRTNPRYRSYSYGNIGPYDGTSKADQPAVMLAMLSALDSQIDDLETGQISYQLRGYANDNTSMIKEAKATRTDLLNRMKQAGVSNPRSARAEASARRRLAKLTTIAADEEERRRAERSRFSGYSYGGYRPDPASSLKTQGRESLRAELDKARAEVDGYDRAAETKQAKRVAAKNPQTASTGAQGRVQKGVPTGGQFSAATHLESDVTL